MNMNIPSPRRLTANEEAALRWIVYLEDSPGANELAAQLDTVVAVGGPPTSLELRTEGPASDLPDGPLREGALVVGADGEPNGDIRVWVEDGRLAQLEYSWFTDEMPLEYPPPDQLALLDPVQLGPASFLDRLASWASIRFVRAIDAVRRRHSTSDIRQR
jgi:hypothetical protein